MSMRKAGALAVVGNVIVLEETHARDYDRHRRDGVSSAEDSHSSLERVVMADKPQQPCRRAPDEERDAKIEAHRGGPIARRDDIEEPRIQVSVE